MTIAVQIPFADSPIDARTNFNYNCFTHLAAKNPGDHFIFIFDRPFNPSLILHDNITPVVLSPQLKNTMLQYYWYNFKLPRVLEKYNANVFISSDMACSLRTKIAQCIFIYDLVFLHKNNFYPKNDSRYLKKYVKRFVNQSQNILVFNTHLKTDLIKSFPAVEHKIKLINPGIDDIFKPADFDTRENIKQKLTSGKEYFLYFATGTSINIITVLKAFSLFKKWQKSNMQLAILFSSPKQHMPVKEFSNYKYRDDVKILYATEKENVAEIISAAYAAIYLPALEITETGVLNALQSGVPLITINSAFYNDFFGDAVLYTNAAEKDISEKMMLLYKDEHKRIELISKGKLMAADNQWENAANLMWQTIQFTAE